MFTTYYITAFPRSPRFSRVFLRETRDKNSPTRAFALRFLASRRGMVISRRANYRCNLRTYDTHSGSTQGDESRPAVYRDACSIIFMMFSRGRYDSRALQAFPAAPVPTWSIPPSPVFLLRWPREWIVGNPTRVRVHHRPVNYSRWCARFWLAVNTFGVSPGDVSKVFAVCSGDAFVMAVRAMTAIYPSIRASAGTSIFELGRCHRAGFTIASGVNGRSNSM